MSSTTEHAARKKPKRRASFLITLFLILGGLVLLATEVLLLSWSRALWVEDQGPHQAASKHGRWMRAYDVDMYVQEFGDPQAPPLVLTHGTGAWAGTWDQNVKAMANAGYRVIAVDLPPFGFSTRPATRDYSRPAQAHRIAALVDSLERGPVTLLGHSYGGGPAAEAAMLYPDRFRHLILVDAAVGMQDEPAPLAEPGIIDTLFGVRALRTALIATLGTQPALSEFWLRQFVARKEVVTPERTAIYREPFVLKGFSASLGDWAMQFGAEHGTFASERPLGYHQLAMPLTLVWGTLDTITPPAQAEAIAKLVPRSQLLMLSGVGHIPQIEDPALFNSKLGEVLAANLP
jgi:pimeloyl-ACP methyl ester carboxylesterase